MRVAHVLRKYVPAEWGGTETALLGLAAGLHQHQVDNVVFHPINDENPTHDPLAATGCAMRRYRAVVPVFGLAPAARQQLLAIGGNVLSFDLPGRLAREPDVSVIHSHTLGRIGGIAGTIARRRGVPFVVTIHGGALDLRPDVVQTLSAPAAGGLEWGRLFGWWWRARHVLAEADAIFTGNRREAELLREQHPGKPIVVQPYGVDTRLYSTDRRAEARAAFPQIEGRDVLLTVARIYPVKNQVWLVRQLPRVIQRHPRVLLVLAGSSTHADYSAELEREIERLGVSRHVLRTGGLPPGDPRLVGLMQEARLAVLPSLAETFGLIIIESWAAGLPAFVTPTSGAKELIRDGEDGRFFNVEDPESFHLGLNQLLGDRAALERLAAAGRQRAAEHDIATLAGQVKALYERLIGEKNALRHSA